MKYKYETFRADDAEFNSKFTDYLNLRASENWHVKHCNYCPGSMGEKMYASCMFEQAD
jgi:hypothetical protein